MPRTICALVVSLFIGSGAVAADKTLKNVDGITLNYPDSWTVATKDTRDAVLNAAKDAFKGKLKGINFKTVKAVLFNEDFSASINIVVTPQRIPVNDVIRKQFERILPAQFKARGMTPMNLKVATAKFGGVSSLSITHVSTFPGGVKSQQWQAFVPGDGKTFVITCAAPPNDFAKAKKTFTKILGSVKVKQPQ